MSPEIRRRIIESIDEVNATLERANKYSTDLRDYDLINCYEAIRTNLINRLAGLYAA